MSPLHRADTIGSLLRPTYLPEARQAWQTGQLALPEFKRIEDRAVEEASRHFPREQLALSTQCGFASVAQGNPISPEVQEQKLRLVVEVAQQVW